MSDASTSPTPPPPRLPELVAGDLIHVLADYEPTCDRLSSLQSSWSYLPPELMRSSKPWSEIYSVLMRHVEEYGENEQARAIMEGRYDDPALRGLTLASRPSEEEE